MTSSSVDAASGRWLELTVEADAEAVEAVSEILGRVSAGTAVRPTKLLRDPRDELSVHADATAPFAVIAHVPDAPPAHDDVDATRRALWHLQAFGLGRIGELRVRSVEADDWTDAWRAHYVPLRIGRVVIVPSWIDEPIGPDEAVVRLDPGMAFGTGLHPTTQACLALLQEVRPMPPMMLDVGCGSGILALAALRLGADRAVGVDTDHNAVTAASANAVLNGLSDRLEARHGSLPAEASERCPLIVANLVAAILIELAPRLAAHLEPGGTLICGGVLEPLEVEVLRSMRAAGLALVERRLDTEWVTLRLSSGG